MGETTRPLSGKRRLGARVPVFSGGKGDWVKESRPLSGGRRLGERVPAFFGGKKAVGVKESRPFLQPKGPAGRRLEPRGKAFFMCQMKERKENFLTFFIIVIIIKYC